MTRTSFSRLGGLLAVGFLTLTLLTACQVDARTEAEAYIRENVTELSPTPAVLGGTFFVTDVEWEDDDTAVVSYEDGHIALRGRTTIVRDGDSVTASEFVLIDADGSAASASSAPSASGSVSSVAERPRAAEGETCGGIAGILCDYGLLCQLDGAYPDASGTCVR